MKLEISNFAKIKKADVIVDGITVIAGENNTGKSTVGKILFSLFNTLSGIDDKIMEERLREIELTNRMILQNYLSTTDIPRSQIARMVRDYARIITKTISELINENQVITETVLQKSTEMMMSGKAFEALSQEKRQDIFNDLLFNIEDVLRLPEETIILDVVSRYFGRLFHSQIKSLVGDENKKATLKLDIKGKDIELYFENNECKHLSRQIDITHKAIYIDNPFIVDELSKYNDLNTMNDYLKMLLTKNANEGVAEGIIEIVRAKEKMADVFEAIGKVVDGDVIVSPSGEYFLNSENFEEPIAFDNLSTGLKSFVILKMLLEKGSLKEKDVIILDEPEVHLHPQWQIAYAELIVLLQKHFNLSVIVTTHSPYFMDAINLFSCKYNTDKGVNYYLSSNVNNTVTLDCVTDNIDLIYKKMASPIQMLETLRYELNNN